MDLTFDDGDGAAGRTDGSDARPRGPLVSGSVKVFSDGPIGGVLRYSVPPGMGVTGVGAGPVRWRDALFPAPEEGRDGIRTAAAIHNVGEEAMEVTCRLMSGGVVLEETDDPS